MIVVAMWLIFCSNCSIFAGSVSSLSSSPWTRAVNWTFRFHWTIYMCVLITLRISSPNTKPYIPLKNTRNNQNFLLFPFLTNHIPPWLLPHSFSLLILISLFSSFFLESVLSVVGDSWYFHYRTTLFSFLLFSRGCRLFVP